MTERKIRVFCHYAGETHYDEKFNTLAPAIKRKEEIIETLPGYAKGTVHIYVDDYFKHEHEGAEYIFPNIIRLYSEGGSAYSDVTFEEMQEFYFLLHEA